MICTSLTHTLHIFVHVPHSKYTKNAYYITVLRVFLHIIAHKNYNMYVIHVHTQLLCNMYNINPEPLKNATQKTRFHHTSTPQTHCFQRFCAKCLYRSTKHFSIFVFASRTLLYINIHIFHAIHVIAII